MNEKRDFEQELKDVFYWFHKHPELSYEEYETTGKIRELLQNAGIEIQPASLETGLIAVIRGGKPGPVKALRCDIDALPIEESTDLSYASLTAGRMHACGHDFHITAGIGCAMLLQQQRAELTGTVKIIFQPAEEESHGALKILETQTMEDVDAVWGIHADPTNEVGKIGIRAGYVTAAVDKFLISVKGAGCHGAHPDDGIDPIPAAAALIQAFQTIITRNINAFHPALISVTRLEAGNTWNVIPATAELEGTVRTMDASDREAVQEKMRQMTKRITAAYGAEGEFTWTAGPPATYNDASMTKKVGETAIACGLCIVEEEQSLGGDDFSYYEEKIPGCYIKIGTGRGPLIHQPGFKVDTKVILPAAEFLAELLLA